MTRVITTRANTKPKVSSSVQNTPESLESFKPIIDNFLSIDSDNIDQLKSVIQDSGLATEMLAILEGDYNLQVADRDIAVGVIINWLSVSNRTVKDSIEALNEKLAIHDVARSIIRSDINNIEIRAGRLDRQHTIPLIGENNHVKQIYGNR
jgi:hypothetical protein